jgi:2-polyprenyl-6-methoxyphenol hydroxylase-like FAD-dependent oxidoreductase
VTLAAHAQDREMRRHLLDPTTFGLVASAIPATAAYVDEDRSEPVTGVHVMAGLVNRRRWFTHADGAPRVLGVHAVGDAHTCTNPLYGRGCSLAMVQAQLLADALDAHGADHETRARSYESASESQITPWYRASVAQDRMGRQDRSDGKSAGSPTAAADTARELLRDGLFPALRVDPVVLRAFLRMMNLLTPPDALMSDGEVVTRVMQVYARRESRPEEPPLGPDRSELLELLR